MAGLDHPSICTMNTQSTHLHSIAAYSSNGMLQSTTLAHNVNTNNEVLSTEPVCSNTEQPAIDIVINNVVCSFSTRCHLNLKRIATEGSNVIYKRENGMVNMKLRKPMCTGTIWSSGKITCTGATSNEDAKLGARRIARILQQLGFKVKFSNYRIVNVLGTCSLPFGIKITHFSRDHPKDASYEPELHPGVTYKVKSPKATIKIFSTGSLTVTAPCIDNVQAAIEHVFPLVYKYKTEKIKKPEPTAMPQRLSYLPKYRNLMQQRKMLYDSDDEDTYDEEDCDVFGSSDEEDDYDSEAYDSDEM